MMITTDITPFVLYISMFELTGIILMFLWGTSSNFSEMSMMNDNDNLVVFVCGQSRGKPIIFSQDGILQPRQGIKKTKTTFIHSSEQPCLFVNRPRMCSQLRDVCRAGVPPPGGYLQR